MNTSITVILAFFVLPFQAEIYANTEARAKNKDKNTAFVIEIQQNNKAPILDGKLSKNEWENATAISNFTQKEPHEGKPISERTYVLISYDRKNIYFGIRCFDQEPQKIVANEMRRDSDLSNNDYVEIIIDTYHDHRNAFYFATNSLGARLDSEIKTEGAHINWDWNGIWHSAARKDKQGWTAEVAIPFKTLRFDKSDSQTWGINFGRYIPRKREEAYWSPISRNDDFDDMGKFKPSKFGILRGLSNIKHDQILQLKPYAIGGVERNFDLQNNSTTKLADIGLDAKIHLTSNIISDITLNTDFAQVEADLEQVNLSRFNLFIPEKRDFFLEGLDIFNIGEESIYDPLTLLFFSRKIGMHEDNETFESKETPIVGGVKITGKEGPYELGFLDVFTNDFKYLNRENNTKEIPQTNYSALRIKRDIFSRSYIGFMGLSKDPASGGNYNRTFAIDGLFSFDNNITVNGYFAKTMSPGLQGKDYNGHVNFSWGTDIFYSNASFTDIGANFNPEMGFLQWSDVRKYSAQMLISPRPEILNIRQSHFTNDVEIITDHNNELQYRTIYTGLANIFQDESYFSIGLINYYDNLPNLIYMESTIIPAGIYKYSVLGVNYSSDLSRKLAVDVQFGYGSFYNGTFTGLNMSNFFNLSNKFRIELNWDWNRVDVPFGNGKFTTSIFGLRTVYSFTPNLFAKTYVQWNQFDKRIISNFLINFIHSPGSNFYLVYNEEWHTNGSFGTSNRAVLAKFTYLLNL